MKQAVFLQFLIFISLCRTYLMLHVSPGPILPLEGAFKAWPSRIHGRILPVLCTQQPRVVPLISSRWFSTSSKLNFISLSQTSIKCAPCSSHRRGLCSFVLCFSSFTSFCQSHSPCHSSEVTEPPLLSCLLLWQQNILTCRQSFLSYCNLKPHFFLLNK